MRTFIALDVPPAALDTITRIQNRFKPLGLHASWTRPGNVHLTLKFLGHTDSGQIPDIRNKLTEALAPFTAFRLALDVAGVFPDTRRPRVLWIGLKDVDARLIPLQAAIEQALEGVGFPRETRPFAPHLTLARIKSPGGIQSPKGIKSVIKELKNELDAVNQEGIDPLLFEVRAIQYYESQLTPKGSIYTVLANFKLNP